MPIAIALGDDAGILVGAGALANTLADRASLCRRDGAIKQVGDPSPLRGDLLHLAPIDRLACGPHRRARGWALALAA